MEPERDKNWASKYLLDPLNEPEPSTETGPGSHFRSTVAPARSDEESKSKQATASIIEVSGYPTPRQADSHNANRFDSRRGSKQPDNPFRASSEIPTSTSKNSINTDVNSSYQKSVSGSERHRQDDGSARPLDIIRKSSLRAHRSPHLRKDHHHGIDSIDKLAGIEGVTYHHDGPFDVVSQARNVSSRDSPVAALRSSNAEALRATPREAVIDALRHHRPIDGVASLPPGVPDRSGRILHYKEGPNMQRGSGENVIGQWPEYYDYHPDDLKGKGEPSFSIERRLKGHKDDKHRRVVSEGYEMKSHPRSTLGENNPFATRARAASGAATTASPVKSSMTKLSETDESNVPYREWSGGIPRSKSVSAHASSSSSSAGKGLLSRKFGSLRRRAHQDGRGDGDAED